jgi:hypothetical protein
VQVLEQEQVNGFEAPSVRWEPCQSVSGLDELGLCAGCGWPQHDHGVEPAPVGAVVIPVRRRERPRLRRAS